MALMALSAKKVPDPCSTGTCMITLHLAGKHDRERSQIFKGRVQYQHMSVLVVAFAVMRFTLFLNERSEKAKAATRKRCRMFYTTALLKAASRQSISSTLLYVILVYYLSSAKNSALS